MKVTPSINNMRKTWIIDLTEGGDTSNGVAIDSLLAGFTDVTGGGDFRWWDYWSIGRTPTFPGIKQLNLAGRLQTPENTSIKLAAQHGTVFLIGCAEHKATRSHFCEWASQLRLLAPADLLGCVGTVQKIGLLQLPDEMFTAGRATDESFVAFLAQLENTLADFDALYLFSNRKDHPYLIAQLIQHLSMPDTSLGQLPRGLCSAGVFALHASWDQFRCHCEKRLEAELWKRFLEEEAPPYYDPSALEGLTDVFARAVDAADWDRRFIADVPGSPELPTEFWAIPAHLSPWSIWNSHLLDHGGFFEGWLRDWVPGLADGNSRMAESVMREVEVRLQTIESDLITEAGAALFQDAVQLGDASKARSKLQFRFWLERKVRHVNEQIVAIRRSTLKLFRFEDEPVLHEILDVSRKDLEEGRDRLVEAAEVRGLTNRLRGHPSLLAFSVRVLFVGTMLATWGGPLLDYLRLISPQSWLLMIHQVVWMVMAFTLPVACMLLSVRLRHNHISQHARKLTFLELARVEKRISDLCADRCQGALVSTHEKLGETIDGFEELCRRLGNEMANDLPPLSHPQLPITAFQRPLLDPSMAPHREPVEFLQVPDADDRPVAFSQLSRADINALLTRLISPAMVHPSLLLPVIETWARGVEEEDPSHRISQISSKTGEFLRGRITYESPGHQDLWREAHGSTGTLAREIAIQSSPGFQKIQGHEMTEGTYNRITRDLDFVQGGVHKEIMGLNGYASWLRYHGFPHMAAAIPNPKTIEAANDWLELGMRKQPPVLAEFHAQTGGVVSIESQVWKIVNPGDLLARIGNEEWIAARSGYLAFGPDIEDGRQVPSGTLVGRILSPAEDNIELFKLFQITKRAERPIVTMGGGEIVGRNQERFETYNARASAE